MIGLFDEYILNIMEYLVDRQDYYWNVKLY